MKFGDKSAHFNLANGFYAACRRVCLPLTLVACAIIILPMMPSAFAQSSAAMDQGRLVEVNVPTKTVAARKITAWLPPGYDSAGNVTRYAVLYMHDGQNLFVPGDAFGGIAWSADRAMLALLQRGAIRPTIIVGIPNAGKNRWQEYAPARALAALPDEVRRAAQGLSDPVAKEDALLADDYLAYLVKEVKPAIDAAFRTNPARDATFVAGSSMGGLVSLYALATYPEVFGGAACLSTHWPVTTNRAFLAMPNDPRLAAIVSSFPRWLKTHLPKAGKHRLYFDFGTQGLDGLYEPLQQSVDRLVIEQGYRFGQDWVTYRFPGADHNERDWAKRLEVPFTFLLAVR